MKFAILKYIFSIRTYYVNFDVKFDEAILYYLCKVDNIYSIKVQNIKSLHIVTFQFVQYPDTYLRLDLCYICSYDYSNKSSKDLIK